MSHDLQFNWSYYSQKAALTSFVPVRFDPVGVYLRMRYCPSALTAPLNLLSYFIISSVFKIKSRLLA